MWPSAGSLAVKSRHGGLVAMACGLVGVGLGGPARRMKKARCWISSPVKSGSVGLYSMACRLVALGLHGAK